MAAIKLIPVISARLTGLLWSVYFDSPGYSKLNLFSYLLETEYMYLLFKSILVKVTD